MIRKTRALATALALLTLGSGLGGLTARQVLASSSHVSSTLTVSWYQEPDTVWPSITGSRSVSQFLRSVVDTLIWLNPKGQVTPDLATSWKISNHAQTYVFNLRKGVTFQDGSPFNAAAVVKTINFIEAPKTHSFSAIGALGPFKDVKALGKYKVRFDFKQPYAAFLPRLGEPIMGFESPKSIAAYQKDPSTMPVSTGPYQIISFTPNQSITLVRYAKYHWGPKALGYSGPGKIDKIVFHISAVSEARLAELQSGQAQLIDGVPGVYYKKYKGNSQFRETALPLSGVGIWSVINNTKFPTNIKAVRQAILYYTNRPAVIKIADDNVFPVSWGPIQKGTLGYFPTFNSWYHYNPAKGTKLMKAAGFKKVNGIWTKGGKKATIDFTAIANNADYPALAQAIQGDLQRAGFNTTFAQFSVTAWSDNNTKGNETMTPLQWTDVDPDALRLLFTPGNPFSWCHYNNPTFTRMVDKAAGLPNMSKRLKIYKQAETILMRDAVMMPLHYNADLVMMAKTLKGVKVYAQGGLILWTASLS